VEEEKAQEEALNLAFPIRFRTVERRDFFTENRSIKTLFGSIHSKLKPAQGHVDKIRRALNGMFLKAEKAFGLNGIDCSAWGPAKPQAFDVFKREIKNLKTQNWPEVKNWPRPDPKPKNQAT